MFDRIRRIALGLVAAAFAALPAAAQPVVVELYTSQGCASCPPADAFLSELAEREDVIALSLHVDYWDYLGWRDIHARKEFTKRQIAYRDAAGERTVYTPQMVIDGVARVVGSRRDEVSEAIRKARAAPPGAEIDLRAVGGMKVAAEITPRGDGADGPCLIWLVSYETPPPVEITRGENAGKTIVYSNVVRSWMRMGAWDGVRPVRFEAPIPEGVDGLAVILQDGKVGPIVGAAKIEFDE